MKLSRWFNLFVILALAAALFPAAATARAQAPVPEYSRDTLFVPGEIVVSFEMNLPAADYTAQANALAGLVSAQVVKQYQHLALLQTAEDADVQALAAQLAAQPGVVSAEPNFISWIPETGGPAEPFTLTEVTRTDLSGGEHKVSIEDLKLMRSRRTVGGKIQTVPTYPNDAWSNWGNNTVNWDIIWPDKAANPTVCVLDTGADANHPDLYGKIVNGYDFINADTLPNDDNGHGTHVAGTIAAKANNGGVAGISSGKVLAVKVLSAQGWGTDFDITSGIYYCANSTAKILSMSLGGPHSTAKYNALGYATLTKGKLVVAAAGNSGTFNKSYPAGYADDGLIGSRIISVGAASPYFSFVDTNNDGALDNYYFNCATSFSNYGKWVEMVAPGESIYSTLPVSYPFWLNYFEGFSSGHDYLNGTSMATPHVAGGAARVWSAYPTYTASQIAGLLMEYGNTLNTATDPVVSNANYAWDGGYPTDGAPFCWPNASWGANYDMSGSRYLNVAAAMNRGAVSVEAVDATTGLPLSGASMRATVGTTAKDTSLIVGTTTRFTDLLNLPAGQVIKLQVYKSGYTYGYQTYIYLGLGPGTFYSNDPWLLAPVPPNKDFNVVANWDWGYDIDLRVYTPYSNPGQIVYASNPGTLLAAPYARWFREGAFSSGDSMPVEAVRIKKNPSYAYPYYPGFYDYILYSWNGGNAMNDANPIIRVWYGGVIKQTIADPYCSSDSYRTWWAGWLYKYGSSTQYYDYDSCGSATPYAEEDPIGTAVRPTP